MMLSEYLLHLTDALVLVILGTVVYRIWTKGVGVVVQVNIPPITLTTPDIVIPPVTIDLSKVIPTPLVVQIQPLGPDKIIVAQSDEVVPDDVYDYVQLESEPYWRDARLKRAKELKHELGGWPQALRALQREDNPPELP